MRGCIISVLEEKIVKYISSPLKGLTFDNLRDLNGKSKVFHSYMLRIKNFCEYFEVSRGDHK